MPSPSNAFVSWPSAPLTDALIRRALTRVCPSIDIVTQLPPVDPSVHLLQWATYDAIEHEWTMSKPSKVQSSSYVIRKALIRKHFLASVLEQHRAKHSATSSVLSAGIPPTWHFELSWADDLDELWADELYDLARLLENSADRKWYILKPGMSDRGNGIRLFNSASGLREIFESFEDSSHDEEESVDGNSGPGSIVASQLRHFVIQEYLEPPLLINPPEQSPSQVGYKFHLRVYCLCHGALSAYFSPNVLALFAAKPYDSPSKYNENSDLSAHLTNTILQHPKTAEESVYLLRGLVGSSMFATQADGGYAFQRRFTEDDVESILEQVSNLLSETLRAALESPVHFQPLPNAFELFGVDFLVTHPVQSHMKVHLLEFNAEPAIEMTGPRLQWILEDLFEGMAKTCLSGEETKRWDIGEEKNGLRKCLDVRIRR